MVFLEVYWLASITCRVCYRIVPALGGPAMGGQEACGSVPQKMTYAFTKDIPPVHAVSRKDIGCAPLKPQR